MLHIAAINQDPGVSPQRAKGAAVHLVAMRQAFAECGAHVTAIDVPDHEGMLEELERGHAVHAFNLVYERYALGCCAGAEFAIRHGLPLVLEVNAPLAEEAARHRGVTETQHDLQGDRQAFSGASLVVAVSNEVAEYAARRGAQPNSVMVCPNGIDTRRFHAAVSPHAARQAGVPGDAFVIGFHGRERPWHGFDRLVDVVRSLTEANLWVHLLVVGEGNFDALATLSPDRFTRVGWQPHEQIPGFVAAFDALPLTYAPDAPCYFSPLKLAEAMACGVVPLVPALGDLSAQVEHGQTGLVYRGGDWKGLEVQLADLVRHPVQRDRIGAAAARFAAGQGWERIAQRILERTGFAMPAVMAGD